MQADHAALIVVDVQNDFLPGGALAVASGDAVIAPINALMPAFDTVVLTADWHPAGHISFADSHPGKHPFEETEVHYGHQALWPQHCVAGQWGAQFAAGLHTDCAHMIVRKGTRRDCDSYSGFMEADRLTQTGLTGYLRTRGVETVYVCGLATDFCVSWTALDARQAGFRSIVIEDASAAIDVNGSLAAAHAAWQDSGVEVILSQQVRNNR